MNETTGCNETPKKPRRIGRLGTRMMLMAGAAAVVGGGALALGNAESFAHGPGGWGEGRGYHEGRGYKHGRHEGRGHHRGGYHKAHWGGGRWFGGGRHMTEEKAERRALRMARKLAWAVDATDEQKTKFEDIAKALVKDVYPLRAGMVDAREQAIDILTSPTVDSAKIEDLRVKQMANAETASKRFADALTEAAGVMTEDQRAKLKSRITALREIRDWWHGGDRDRDRERGGDRD